MEDLFDKAKEANIFAIGRVEEGKPLCSHLLCRHYRKSLDDKIYFEVINGLWRGKLTRKGFLTVNEYPTPVLDKNFVLWCGDEYGDYNTILNKINEELGKNDA